MCIHFELMDSVSASLCHTLFSLVSTLVYHNGRLTHRSSLRVCNGLKWHQRGWDPCFLPSLSPQSVQTTFSWLLWGKHASSLSFLMGAKAYQSHLSKYAYKKQSFSTLSGTHLISEQDKQREISIIEWKERHFLHAAVKYSFRNNFLFPWWGGKGHTRHPHPHIEKFTTEGQEEEPPPVSQCWKISHQY